jgi:CheY-like chemotaxis protein
MDPRKLRTRISTHYLLTASLAGIVVSGLPTLVLNAQSPNPQASSPGAAANGGSGAVFIVVMIVLLLLVVVAPLGVFAYRMIRGAAKTNQALLIVSTDEEASKLVKAAAKRVGYTVLHVYRYEDAIDKLKQAAPISIIIIDDSVPQYEAGLLVALLNRMPMGIRPLILINDSSELGQTAPSYRAEAVVSRPLTLKTVESAIRKVSERLEQERVLGLS